VCLKTEVDFLREDYTNKELILINYL